jgi:hypothetical protein
MSLGRFAPSSREVPDETKARVWKAHGYVVVDINDPRLPWDLKEQLARFMTRQHGVRNGEKKPA